MAEVIADHIEASTISFNTNDIATDRLEDGEEVIIKPGEHHKATSPYPLKRVNVRSDSLFYKGTEYECTKTCVFPPSVKLTLTLRNSNQEIYVEWADGNSGMWGVYTYKPNAE